MEIILKKDVANLGHADDIVNVKTGYAVNYLIPQGFAIMATPSAKKVHAENLRQRAHKIAKFVADAEALAAKLETQYRRDERIMRFLTFAMDKHAVAYAEKRRANKQAK